ncbi:MAG: biosynthetic arginine decarboxylase [Deltaproteobacteria bacterium]|jgi:arginine decarboxylase|nr:biosynthetic arginine decarboxylase [Deltaproteobacteria bacterium]
MTELEKWNSQRSENLYEIKNWGAGYFGINQEGHVLVYPHGQTYPAVDLYDIVQSAIEREIQLPILLRFNDILRHRIQVIQAAFKNAIAEYEYQSSFFHVYPLKVNQQAGIVKVISQVDQDFNIGLEVGSKTELLAAMGVQENKNALLLCNGYKDREFIELALISCKLCRRVILIVEKLSELKQILELANDLKVTPEIGFRIRISGKGSGRWVKSGGDRAKFGLTINEVLWGVEELEHCGMQSALKLIHFHLGSQLTTISNLRVALKEAMQIYVQLKKRCVELSFLDIGGGLGVDYDGSKTNFESSMNYTTEEYARDVVWTIDEVCRSSQTNPPHIIIESGRATVAYHSVLIFNVLGIANTFPTVCNPQEIIAKTKNHNLKELSELFLGLTPKNCQETLNDALELRSEIMQQFNMGLISIEDRARTDQCFWSLLHAITEVAKKLNFVPEDIQELPSLLTDTYFCNFSVFQSIADSWAIKQLFPVIPIHRLNEEPLKKVTLADITCDSDGKIDRFVDVRDVKSYLPVHELRANDPYYLGAFLVGAYQETLGDLHNLFGDTNAIHIEVTPAGRVDIVNVVNGDTMREVLRYVQYDKEILCSRWRSAIEQAVSEKKITAIESAQIFKIYHQAFEHSTYLNSK